MELINRLYDDAWTAYESARPFLAPIQAVWAVETMSKGTEQAYRAVKSKMTNLRGNKMDELREKLARLRAAKLEVEKLEAEIKAAVIAAGETIKAPGIVVSYVAGRKTYDWQAAAMKAAEDMDGEKFQNLIDENTTPTVDWKKVATEAGVVNCPFKQGKPSASVKVVDDEIAPFPEFPAP